MSKIINNLADVQNPISLASQNYVGKSSPGTPSDTGKWFKVATFHQGTGNYIRRSHKLVVMTAGFVPMTSVQLTVHLNQDTAGMAATSRVIVDTINETSGRSASACINPEHFRLIGGATNGDPITLWMMHNNTYGEYNFYEVAYPNNGQIPYGFSVEYHSLSAYETAPSGGVISINGTWSGEWLSATTQNGWTAEHCRYRKNSSGLVELSFNLYPGTTTDNTIVFQLPVGYRPGDTYRLHVATGSSTVSTTASRYTFSTDGAVRIYSWAGGSGFAGHLVFLGEN